MRPAVRPNDVRVTPAIGGNQKVAERAADQADKNSSEDTGSGDADYARIQELHEGNAVAF